jgi:alanine-glyoxylate transaminase/serine-glyoxylate transaminase/serine-pyruvate transaminase
MLPPGLAFNVLSDRALEAARKSGGCPRFFWDWNEHLGADGALGFISTPAIPLWYGLAAALEMLFEEGPETVFARHRRLAGSVRAAVAGWNLELVSTRPTEHSDTVTAILLPAGVRPDAFRSLCREQYGVVLAAAIGRWAANGFRIGHLGALSEAMILGTLGATELALADAGIPHQSGGAAAALASLRADQPGETTLRAVG